MTFEAIYKEINSTIEMITNRVEPLKIIEQLKTIANNIVCIEIRGEEEDDGELDPW